MAEELEALHVKVGAVLVGTPLRSAEAVIKHGRNCVGAQPVDVVYVHPEKCGGYQKV